MTFVRNDTIKHIATGGYWYDIQTEEWVHGGPQVITYLEDHPEQARLLGIPDKQLADPGMANPTIHSHSNNGMIGTGRILATDQTKHEITLWHAMRCADIFKKHGLKSPSYSQYHQGMSVVTSEHETSQLGAHIIFRDMLKKVRFVFFVTSCLLTSNRFILDASVRY
jgi:hypothetical protein